MFRLKSFSLFFRSACLAVCGCALLAGCGPPARIADAPMQKEHLEHGDCVRLTVVVSGFRNDTGSARAALFLSGEGFPNDSEQAFRRALAPIRGCAATLVFDAVPPGVYALAVLHDENENGRLDTNAAGMPLEGYGASNNPASFFGPPGFEASRFQATPPETFLSITLRYVF